MSKSYNGSNALARACSSCSFSRCPACQNPVGCELSFDRTGKTRSQKFGSLPAYSLSESIISWNAAIRSWRQQVFG